MRPREHVLVVGGGIAGLTLAATLDPRRFAVTLVEERPDRAGAGTVLALWPRAADDLDRIDGVGAHVRGAAHPVDHGALRDADGRVLVRSRAHGLAFVPRPTLIATLDAAVPRSVTRMTREVTDPGLLGHEVGADLVIGADGVRSTCRQATFIGSAPVETGWVALRGHLDERPQETSEWWGPGGMFGVTPGPMGGAWFCAVRSDPGHAEALEAAKRQFADWDPRLREILHAAGAGADVQRILVAPPLRRIVGAGTVLVGDAAHGMAPNLGRGANEAIRDATCLAAMLHRHEALGAPAPFARRRHVPTQALRLASSVALRTATAHRTAPLRDGLLRAWARAC